MSISAALVKELRERTGAGMMDCKKALSETGGDIDQAIDLMRKTGAAKAAKKSARIAAEGLVHIASNLNRAAVVEVNSETDFVSKSGHFKGFVAALANTVLLHKPDNMDVLLTQKMDDGIRVEDARQHLIAKIGENIALRRFAQLEVSQGEHLGIYQHGSRIGVLVCIRGGSDELAKDIAMHIAASRPECISADEVPATRLERERSIFIEQAKQSGKPDDIIEKMVAGKIKKFVEEITLQGQPFVKNPDVSISQLLKDNQAKVVEFVRFEVGEGIEKKADNFVEEVMAQAKGKTS